MGKELSICILNYIEISLHTNFGKIIFMAHSVKIFSERQLCGLKCLVDVSGQRRMDRLVGDDRKATVTQIS